MDFSIQLDTLWVLLGTALVFFMQAGFAMVETGLTRAKNAGNIIMKNLMDFVCGSIVFWIVGYGIMYGSANSWFGGIDLFGAKLTSQDLMGNIPSWTHLIFNTVFCATAATIVSGSMAERTQFKSYLVYSVVISALIYPIEGHWIWGGGWLSTLSIAGWTGFHDFAGSTAVHMTGGIAALVGAKILGPRIGKYSKDGKAKAIPGHSLTLAALGVFILWFGWFGFNPASTYGLSTVSQAIDASNIFMTTNIAAACAALVSMTVTWVHYKKPDVSMTLNGALAGLVAITAGCSAVDPWAAAIIGAIAGLLVVVAVEFIDKVLKIDDPVGAIGVHGVCGAWGTIAVGLFGREGGLFLGGGVGRTLVQLTGVAAVAVFVTVTIAILFFILKKTFGLRVSREEEIQGLDMLEHGLVSCYADFMPSIPLDTGDVETSIIPPKDTVPVSHFVAEGKGKTPDGHKYTKIVIIAKESKLNALKEAMNAIGITGMTVSNVMGCGIQKGASEFYRGVPLDITLLPKVKVEIVVSKVPVRTVIETAKKVLYTGHIGDGKIFISDLENVIKVRTGEEGYDALQNNA
jgi:Amt family ammonium transporter